MFKHKTVHQQLREERRKNEALNAKMIEQQDTTNGVPALERICGMIVQEKTETVQAADLYAIKRGFETWEALVDKGFTAEKAGYIFGHGDNLYKTVQPGYTFVSHYVPGAGTESLFTMIPVPERDEGTIDTPIAYSGNMELFAGKYYEQNGVVYLCNRDTGTAVYHDLSALVGLYVETVE